MESGPSVKWLACVIGGRDWTRMTETRRGGLGMHALLVNRLGRLHDEGKHSPGKRRRT
jgi:hypothetical protein